MFESQFDIKGVVVFKCCLFVSVFKIVLELFLFT